MIKILVPGLLLIFISVRSYSQPSCCTDTGFRKVYFTLQDSLEAFHHTGTLDTGYLMTGKCTPVGSPTSGGFAMRLDRKAEVVWGKHFDLSIPGKQFSIGRAIQVSNGDMIMGGKVSTVTAHPIDNFTILRTDGNGNALWSYSYQVDPTIDAAASIQLESIAEGYDGDLLIVASVNGSPSPFTNYDGGYGLFLKLDKDGNILVSKSLLFEQGSLNNTVAVFPQHDRIIILGVLDDGMCPGSDERGLYGLQMNYADGSLMGVKRYCFNTTTPSSSFSWFGYDFSGYHIGNEYYLSGFFDGGTPSRKGFLMARLDTNLNYLGGLTIDNPIGGKGYAYIGPSSSGNASWITDGSQTGNFYYSTVNGSGEIKRQRKFPETMWAKTDILAEGGQRMVFSNNGRTTFIANSIYANLPSIELLQFSDNDASNSACLGADTAIFSTTRPFGVYSSNLTINTFNGNLLRSPLSLNENDLPVSREDKCVELSSCRQLKITGADTVCVLGQAVTYTAHTNAACHKHISWHLDSSFTRSMTILDDSTVSVLFKMNTPGAFPVKLIASAAGCDTIVDSITVTLFSIGNVGDSPLPLCPGDSIRITPGNWFKSYAWQDGSTDSVLEVRKSGTYTVSFTNYCGGRQKAGITIRGVPPPWNMGKDTALCKGDTILLQANKGFERYEWEPDPDLRQLSDDSALVYPTSNTFYVLSVLAFPGCIVKDTITISVADTPSHFIATDTSVCMNAKILISPSSTAFIDYLWDNGSELLSRWVDQPGEYYLQVTDSNGCKGREGINVKEIACSENNFMLFPNAFTPNNDGRNDLFRPRVGGTPSRYELAVYNRWGERIFHSVDPFIGWDGGYGGRAQETGSYIWICTYQFQGKPVQMEKGSVLLIK